VALVRAVQPSPVQEIDRVFIDRVLVENIGQPVGPEFMPPPDKAAA